MWPVEQEYLGMNLAKKVGIGSELKEQVLVFESQSATPEALMVKAFKRIVGSSGGSGRQS